MPQEKMTRKKQTRFSTYLIPLFLLTLLLSLYFFAPHTPLLSLRKPQKGPHYRHPINDGPYVFRHKKQVVSFCIRNSRLIVQKIRLRGKTFQVRGPLGFNNYTIPTAKPKIGSHDFQGISKIFIVSDIHGQFDRFKQLLVNNKIADERMQWRWGKGHLVIVGDVFDRGPTVNEALWALHQLEQQARKKGGCVHFLLGNHESLVLRGDERYVHPKYAYAAEYILKLPVPALYGHESVLGQWLRTKPTIIRINDMLFVHGGIHPDLLTMRLGIEGINNIIRTNLDKPSKTLKENEIFKFLFFRNGPLWYRGFFGGKHFEKLQQCDIETILKAFKVNRIIVGHTGQDKITPYFENRVWAVDAGIQYGDRGEALLWENGKFYRALAEGKPVLVFPGEK